MTKPRYSPEEASELFGRLVDGLCDLEEQRQLADWIRTDPAARQAYLDYIEFEAELILEHVPPAAIAPESGLAEEQAEPVTEPRLSIWERGYDFVSNYIVLSLLLSAIFMTIIVLSMALIVPDWGRSGAVAVEPEIEVVARITGARQAVFDGQSDATRIGYELLDGESIALRSGLAEVTFASGAVVTLAGPVQFVASSANAGNLVRGKLSASVPQQAVGFEIATESGTVVDLGTEFDVTVDNRGHTDVRVIEGRVQWVFDEPQSKPVMVTAGQFVRILNGQVKGIPIEFALGGESWPESLSSPDQDAVYASDELRCTGFDVPGPTMIRTLRSDYQRHDWTATFVFKILRAAGVTTPAYIGVGPGEIDQSQYFSPVARPNALISFRTDHKQIHAFDNSPTPVMIKNPRGRIVHRFGIEEIEGSHRVTLRWDSSSQLASWEYDHGDNAKADTKFVIDASDNHFTDGTARVFFGGDGVVLQRFELKASAGDPNGQ